MIKQLKLKKISIISVHVQPSLIPITDTLYVTDKVNTYQFFGLCKNGVWVHITLEIPKRFYCDGQSAPRFLWWFMRPDGLVRIGALIHDALYRTKGGKIKPIKNGMNKHNIVKLTSFAEDITIDRKSCDLVYREFYKKYAPKQKRKANIGYAALRIFGGRHFGNIIPSENKK